MKFLTKSIIVPAVLMLLGTLVSQAQNRYTLKGQVMSEAGDPLPGAMVIPSGNVSGGVMADANGIFAVEVAKTDSISVSMLSFESRTLPVAGRTSITVKLKESAEMLESVVLIGYGEQNAKDVTGSVTAVNMSEIKSVATHDVAQAMQGRVAGVVLSSNDGQPGEEMNILIRGANSVTQSNAPLYVIDGFPMEDFSMSSLNPEDIKSISILKDASAGAIYGARGANGVVIIETKTGAGKVAVEYSGNFGVQQVSKLMPMMDAYEYVRYCADMGGGDTYFKDGMTLEDYRGVQGTSWQSLLFRPAFVHNHSLSISGGTASTKYSVSGGYTGQDGVIIGTGYNKAMGRIKFEQGFLGDKLVFKANLSYTRTNTTGDVASEAGSSTSSWQSYLMYRVWSFSPMKEAIIEDEETGEEAVVDVSLLNPVLSAKNSYRNVVNNIFYGSASLVWNITPDLKLTEMFGYSATILDTKRFFNSKTYSGYQTAFATKGVNGSYENKAKSEWMNDITLNYKKKFRNKRDVLNAMATFSMAGLRNSRYYYSTIQVPDENLGISGISAGTPTDVKSIENHSKTMSFLGRVNYSFDSRYLVTVSFRADGSSKFPPKNRWGFFPSAALGWRIKNESFLRNVRPISDLKLRASWGITGNNRIGDNTYYPTIGYDDHYAFNTGTPETASGLQTIANSDLSWEKTMQWDLGLDYGMFDSRVNLTVDLYRKTTSDLLLNAYVPYSTGVSSATLNVGSVQNQGVELTLSTVNVRGRNFTWTSDFNISFNDNKVLALANNQTQFTTAVGWTGDFSSTPLYITRVGGPIAAFYTQTWDGVYTLDDFNVDAVGNYVLKSNVPDNGGNREQIQPGDIKYVDRNGDGTITDDDMTMSGRAIPVCTGGFGNEWRWKGLSLNVFLQWSYGNKVFNANRIALEGNYAGQLKNQLASYADRWSFDNQDSRIYRAGGYGPRGVYSTRTLEDGSYLRIKNISLAYDFPRSLIKKAKMTQCQLYLSAQNVWTFTSYSGIDPEVSTFNSTLTPGFDYSAYPRNRVYTLGLKLAF
ncbi:MAG: TonB-dependent receptor [Bacteroidales bacterium]|nr:TonB-dependent receptor [Bacteroidales bacterium]